ncbi:hypothetical protein WN48_02928 [Eufriesea mexicana]|nr:hypothetical protein WN48_02928 [Eufriesea mexicana]
MSRFARCNECTYTRLETRSAFKLNFKPRKLAKPRRHGCQLMTSVDFFALILENMAKEVDQAQVKRTLTAQITSSKKKKRKEVITINIGSRNDLST